MEEMVTSLTTGVTTMAADALGAIGKVAPAAFPILGGVIVVGVIIAIVKKLSGSKT